MAVSTPHALGIFGGTFDPPHVGHLILAQAACNALGLSQVLFVPAADPPHKQDQQITDIKHRVAMLEAAIAGNPSFRLSDVDITRPGPHYTVDTIKILHAGFPKAQLYFLMGGDALRDFATWHDPGGILARSRLAVMLRPGVQVDMAHVTEQFPDAPGKIVFFATPEIGISATSLREEIRAGHSVRYQVPDAVEHYIGAHSLYR